MVFSENFTARSIQHGDGQDRRFSCFAARPFRSVFESRGWSRAPKWRWLTSDRRFPLFWIVENRRVSRTRRGTIPSPSWKTISVSVQTIFLLFLLSARKTRTSLTLMGCTSLARDDVSSTYRKIYTLSLIPRHKRQKGEGSLGEKRLCIISSGSCSKAFTLGGPSM